MSDVDKALDFFFRMCDDNLTDNEKRELAEFQAKEKAKDRKISNNPYCSCGCFEGEEELSLDTH